MLKPGQPFYEGPDDVHVVGRGASSTEPAKFLVSLVKDQGAPILQRISLDCGGRLLTRAALYRDLEGAGSSVIRKPL